MAGQQQDRPEKGLITLGGLWLHKSRSGRIYMTGRLGLGGKLMIFANTKNPKEGQKGHDPKAPDYYAVIGEWVQSEGGQQQQQQTEDDVPF